MDFTLPTKGNKKLALVLEKVRKNRRLEAYLKCCNVMAIDRLGYSDHGPTHIKIVSNIALRLLRILVSNGIQPGVVKNYKLKNEDAEVIVLLACCLHDIGHAIHRSNHADFTISLSLSFLEEFLKGIYDEPEIATMISETLHAMRAHESDFMPLTLEAGIVRLSDALDMERGRARIPFEAGSVNIHSVSALAIEKVEVKEGSREKPIAIRIRMNNSAGIFQIDELLKTKLKGSQLEKYVSITAEVSGPEKKIVQRLQF
ncbi:MAG: HD domain-containing protein [Thermoproteota archaeon]